MKECENCKSTNIEETTKSLPNSSDNIVKVYICQDCGFAKIGEVIHIG